MNKGRTVGIASAVIVVGLVVGLVAGFPRWREQRAFDSVNGVDKGESRDLKRVRQAYESFIAEFPHGKHTEEARVRARDLAMSISRQEEMLLLQKSIGDALASESLKATRERLLARLKESPTDKNLLLQLAFLSWGFDTFRIEAWQQSQDYVQKTVGLYPECEFARRIKEHNEANQPDTSSRFMAFSSLVDTKTGRSIWKAVDDPEVGHYLCDSNGVAHLGTTPSGLRRLDDIKNTRRAIINLPNQPSERTR